MGQGPHEFRMQGQDCGSLEEAKQSVSINTQQDCGSLEEAKQSVSTFNTRISKIGCRLMFFRSPKIYAGTAMSRRSLLFSKNPLTLRP